ncbi:HAD family hydrolase [Roseivivax isoporae]|uniref:Haloacid dehalogenase n=1 Tax=Roseivivax isoporae LMG 25204 TaxID=1449351 RepID=X7F4P4_9RHOB|nr:HAD family phosphatase [Roseivivax isoporae]ETX27897.1 haloacid dehalogenase [Roseivivax isoporae LMG 25204]
MTIGAVVFDIGNVLIEWQPERHYDAVIGRARREALFAEVDLHTMNDAIDRGGDFRETVMACADRHPDWADEIRLWHDSWLRLAGPAIPQSVAALRGLRDAGVPVFALSNFGVGTFAVAEPEYPFLAEFDRRYISGHMGMAKPDHDIYAALEEDCGVPPGQLLFTDDRADNIAVAAARGWQTHLFEGPEGWLARLRAEGLLTAAA